MKKTDFKARVYGVVAQIPRGRVMTYGQIAAICGSPRAARIVGSIAHFGATDLPWQRVVNKNGGLADGYWGGREGQKKDLEIEGVTVFGTDGDYKVDVDKLLWAPRISS